VVGELSAEIAAVIVAYPLGPLTVREIDIQEAIVVIVKDADAGAGPFDDVVQVAIAVALLEVESGLFRDVGEADACACCRGLVGKSDQGRARENQQYKNWGGAGDCQVFHDPVRTDRFPCRSWVDTGRREGESQRGDAVGSIVTSAGMVFPSRTGRWFPMIGPAAPRDVSSSRLTMSARSTKATIYFKATPRVFEESSS
jgi:hypothetical protein